MYIREILVLQQRQTRREVEVSGSNDSSRRVFKIY